MEKKTLAMTMGHDISNEMTRRIRADSLETTNRRYA
jgi:hypothetical protein